MPRVPKLNPDGVGERAINTGRVSTRAPVEAFGGGSTQVQQAANHTALSIERVAAREKTLADKLAVLEADKAASEFETNLLHDPKTGAFNRRGKDAFGAHEEVVSVYQNKMDEIGRGLSNDEQRFMFDKLVAERSRGMDRQLNQHVSRELQRHDNEVTEAFMHNEMNAAVANYQDPERIELALERQVQAIQENAIRNGLSKEAVEHKVTQAVSKTHTSVIARMLANGDDLKASKYFKENKKEITGEDATRLEKALEEGSLRGESQRRADAIMDMNKSRADSIEMVRKIKDPKVRDETERRVLKDFTIKAAAQKEAQEQLYMGAVNKIEKLGLVSPHDVKDHVDPETWSKLTIPERKALESRVSDVPHNHKKWLDFRALKDDDLVKINRHDFEVKWWAHFGKKERERAVNLWSQAREGKGKDKKFTPSKTLSFAKRVIHGMKRAGMIDANKSQSQLSKKDAELFTKFELEASRRIEEFENEKRRPATGKEIQVIIDEMTMEKGKVDGFFSDSDVWLGNVDEDDVGSVYIPYDKIPPAVRRVLSNELRKRGKEVTDDKIERLYGSKKTDNWDRFKSILEE